MESSTEGVKPTAVKESSWKKLGKFMRKAIPRGQEVVPVDEFDTRAACVAIANLLKPSQVFSKPDDEILKTFSVIEQMAELGHHNVIDDPKLNEQYKRGKEKLSLIDHRLIKEDLLADVVLDEPDENGEVIRYQLRADEDGVVDRSYNRIVNIAEGKLTLEEAA